MHPARRILYQALSLFWVYIFVWPIKLISFYWENPIKLIYVLLVVLWINSNSPLLSIWEKIPVNCVACVSNFLLSFHASFLSTWFVLILSFRKASNCFNFDWKHFLWMKMNFLFIVCKIFPEKISWDSAW